MATKTDPVLLVVELVDNVSEQLMSLQASLERLDNQIIDPTFDLDDDGQISRLQLRMKMLERRMTAKWVPDISEADFAKVLGARKALERRMGVNMRPSRISGFNLLGVPNLGVFEGLPRRRGRMNQAIEGLNDKFRSLGHTLKRATPSIMDWWQVLALLIPVIITLGAALVGVVAALGGMAVAASAVVGIGLVGWGDNASESMQELRMEFSRLKGEMFAAIQPAATEFAPISRGFVRGIPEQVARLNDELKRLTSFEEGLAAAGGGLIGWVEESIDAIADMQEMVVQVALRMGQALGEFLIELLEFGLKELYKNQDAYIKLAEIFIDIIAILFNLSKAITFALSTFKPLFDFVVALTGWMGNKFVTAILTAVIGLSSMAFVLGNVMAWLLGIKSLGMLSFLARFSAGVLQLTGHLWQLWVNLQLIHKALIGIAAATGVGLLAWGIGESLAATSGPSPNTAGIQPAQRGGTVNNINIEGNVGKREMNRLLDHLETQK